MKDSIKAPKFMRWAISVCLFALVCFLLIHLGMILVDFYDGMGLETNGGDGDDQISDDNSDTNVGTDDGKDDKEPENNNEEKSEYVTNLSKAYGPGFVEGLFTDISLKSETELASLYLKLTKDITDINSQTDITLSKTGVYEKSGYLLVKSGLALPETFAVGTKTVKVAEKYTKDSDSQIYVKYVDSTADITAVELYMGHIIINTEDKKASLLDSDGDMLCEDMGSKSPAYKRTSSGTPVFTDASGAYYVFDTEKLEFVSVKATDVVSALTYDYPEYSFVNEKDEKIYASYDPSKRVYRYYSANDGEISINTNYSYAHTFNSQGYALVKNSSGTMCIIDSLGKVVHTASVYSFEYFPDSTGLGDYSFYVRRYYAMPYTTDISAIGSGTVDEYGWTRIRVLLRARAAGMYNDVIADYETLVNVSGEFFNIPKGYTLEGYSDGVLLLSRNGLYGYYSVQGKWITNPIYTYAQPFIQGLAVVGYEDGTKGMIDTDGNIVLPFAFRYISNVSGGLISAYSESGKWEIFKLVETNIK